MSETYIINYTFSLKSWAQAGAQGSGGRRLRNPTTGIRLSLCGGNTQRLTQDKERTFTNRFVRGELPKIPHKEVGIDTLGQMFKDSSELLESDSFMGYDFAIDAKRLARFLLAAFRYFGWGLDDPAAKGTEAERMAIFRCVRDEIERRILEFIAKES